MKKIDVLLFLSFLVVISSATTACGRYGRLFLKKDIAKQQAILQEDKTNSNNEQDEIIIQ